MWLYVLSVVMLTAWGYLAEAKVRHLRREAESLRTQTERWMDEAVAQANRFAQAERDVRYWQKLYAELSEIHYGKETTD